VIKIALCGFGYWGPNLLRNFLFNSRFQVVAIAERRPEAHEAIRRLAPTVMLYEEAADAIRSSSVDAVAIATPVGSHYSLTRMALEAKKHVLVEKPLCASLDEAIEIVEIAERNNVTLMVDHTFLFHPAVQKIAQLTRSGELGTVSYYDGLRVNLGLFQPDVNVLWDLAPHDLSIIDHLFDEEPFHVQANGYCHLNPRLPDIAYVTLHFPSRMVAHLNLSWMSPIKVRRIAVGGSNKMVVWDDLDRDEPIRIYDSGISVLAEEDRPVIIPGYRVGDVHAPRLPQSEALAGVVEHFGAVIDGRSFSIMDGRKGLRIMRILDASQRSLDASLAGIDAHYRTAQPPSRPAINIHNGNGFLRVDDADR
jgi:predicted dehydrogenase